MDDGLSTTRPACDPVAACPCSCTRGWQEVQHEVNEALDSPNPLERNRRITAAYERLAEADPNNLWVRLAGYVSVQGGCAMRVPMALDTVAGVFPPIRLRPKTGPDPIMGAPLDVLQDANRTIFSSIYPVVRFAQKCGAERLRLCAERGDVEAHPDFLDAMDLIEHGDLEAAAYLIADHEQTRVVQPVYDRHWLAFKTMQAGDYIWPQDLISIPIAKTCTRADLVSISGLNISDPQDRVLYYERLMQRMLDIETGR